MAKFSFKLQSLLNIKIQLEDSLKNQLGRAIQKLEQEKAILRTFEQHMEECINEINNKSMLGTTVASLREYNSYMIFLKEKIELQKENVNWASINVDKYREELVKAVQERKMMENLKQKQYEDYMKEQNRDEQKKIDEVISFNYNNLITGEDHG